jgi:transcriptional regulator with XRE-family HTH domain
MKYNLKHVGENIRSARKKKNLTLEVLSGLADVTESFLGMVERGASSLSIETLISICDALDMTPNSLLMEGRGDKPRPSDKRDTLNIMLKNATDDEIDFYINFVKFYRGSGMIKSFKNISNSL